ncbi:hypothetical protein B9G55_06480 [Saccharibacillus sp. O16]|nr:hypothetical protein B9G55_06480 [Saccharibacillus sp. O16]
MVEQFSDYIVSGSRNERYARIEYAHSRELEYYCHGRMLENRFPERLSWLLEEYDQLVQHVIMTLIDDVEEEIFTYDLHLENTGQRIHTLMLTGDEVSFFITPAFDEEDARWTEEALRERFGLEDQRPGEKE